MRDFFRLACTLLGKCNSLKDAIHGCTVDKQLEVAMKTRHPIALLSLVAFAVFTVTHQGNAQRTPRAKVQSLHATSDKTGQHAATAEIAGPARITCINAASETPNTQPPPSCYITAPGFKGNLKKGETANATGAGTVTLTCNGQGNLRCNARIG
jgi:hypothetical protein